MSDRRTEWVARQLHLLDFFSGRCLNTWAECDADRREEYRTSARDVIRDYAAKAAQEN